MSKVYFTDMHISDNENLPQKFKRLILTAGIDRIDFENKYVAIKLHFGERGNLAYLRPQYARALADVIRDLGGKPFLTDCNTLYPGSRKHALEHIDTAYENGYTPYATGCHVIIADGIRGGDEVYVPIDGEYVKEAKIGSAIMAADIVISLTHFKCHEQTGIGGAIKNLGMGCGSRAGKMEMHASGKPVIVKANCILCGACAKACAHGAPVIRDGKMFIDHEKCLGCGRCIARCPMDAVVPGTDSMRDELNCKMTEYAYAVCKDRPHFHISLAIDISPCCDCHNSNDVPVVPDVGMFASFDPVAIDQACCDAVNAQKPLPSGCIAGETGEPIMSVHPDTNWHTQLLHGKKIGLGTDEYELIKI
ncbi:MAG: DUF362 domain-containing protein [Oscillospiraceae bacterium]|nr:DUF362 domain-containing protein [Oscillospiraceae bacterium]